MTAELLSPEMDHDLQKEDKNDHDQTVKDMESELDVHVVMVS